MKKVLFYLSVVMVIVLGSCELRNESLKIQEIQQTSFEFSMDIETQDAIAYQVAEACTNPNFIYRCRDFVNPSHSLVKITLNPNDVDETDELYESIQQLWQETPETLKEYINGICSDNYLQLNLYIPNQYNIIETFQDGGDIIIVNALYRDAIITEEEDNYYVAYHISNGIIHESQMAIDEVCANSHLTIILSFRDEITNWQHFAKGSQSYSDLLLRNTIRFAGYGCTTEEEVENSLTEFYRRPNDFFGRKYRIVYGKGWHHFPCDDRYKRICDFEPMPVNGLWSEWMTTDPYRTAWMYMNYEQSEQYIYVSENLLNLDLEGYDFVMNEMIFHIDDRIITVPQQICYYDAEHNALRFNVEYQ
jgi:hypothetical protein